MLSRSAETHPATADLIKELEASGCRAAVRNCDASESSNLAAALQSLLHSGIPPIRGVVHAAMALHVSEAYPCL